MVTPIQVTVLEKMYRQSYIGGRHTSIDNLPKGFPPDVRGQVSDEVKRLIRQGWIVPKATSYGLQVSLNPRRIGELKALLLKQSETVDED